MTKQEALNKIEDLKNYIKNLDKEPAYRRGDRFIINGEEYILYQVDNSRRMCLIDLKFGNRWDNPIEVKNTSEVTEKELKKMTSFFDSLADL